MKKDDAARNEPRPDRPLSRKAVQRLVRQKGLTLAKLAEIVGVSTPWMSRLLHYERVGKLPSADLLAKVCDALDCQPDDILQADLSSNPLPGKGMPESSVRELQAELTKCSAMQLYGLVQYAQALLDERLRDRPDLLAHLG